MSEDFLRRFPEPCFFVRSSASKGRFLTASKPIAAGDIVIQENSYAFVPFGELLDRVRANTYLQLAPLAFRLTID
jgi:hypothetical protein